MGIVDAGVDDADLYAGPVQACGPGGGRAHIGDPPRNHIGADAPGTERQRRGKSRGEIVLNIGFDRVDAWIGGEPGDVGIGHCRDDGADQRQLGVKLQRKVGLQAILNAVQLVRRNRRRPRRADGRSTTRFERDDDPSAGLGHRLTERDEIWNL